MPFIIPRKDLVLGGAHMRNGFYQIERAENDRPTTRFTALACHRLHGGLTLEYLSIPATVHRVVGAEWIKWVYSLGNPHDIVYSGTGDKQPQQLC